MMEFRFAVSDDISEINKITEQAKSQLRMLNTDQWQKGYPSEEVWREDIKNNMAYVAVENGSILGVFAFQTTDDVSYGEIEGEWLTDTPYASIHRVCVADRAKGKGVAGEIFRHGFIMAKALGFKSVRIDTHQDNVPMQRALIKSGFRKCGKITLMDGCEKGDPRVAFEYVL